VIIKIENVFFQKVKQNYKTKLNYTILEIFFLYKSITTQKDNEIIALAKYKILKF